MSIATIAAAPRQARLGWMALTVLLAVAAAVYVRRLGDAPVHLAHDEVLFALNAYSMATTGHAEHGEVLPVYVHVSGNYWLTPMPIYLDALMLKVLPLSETAVRLSSVLVALVGIALMYLVALRLFHRVELALVAAALLALTPAYFIHARLGVDHLYPVPFVLAWLLSVLDAADGRRRMFVASAAILGLGVYTYFGSVMAMPILLLLTCAFIWRTAEKPLPICVAAIAVFMLSLVPLAISLRRNPTELSDHVRMYGLYDPSRLTPLQGIKELLNYTSLTSRIDVYWGYFNPSFLFLAGDASLINSTRLAGVLPIALAVLLPLGIYRIVHAERTPFAWLLLASFVAAPAAAVVVGEPHRINRALGMVPLAILISMIGLASLYERRSRLSRVVGVLLLMLVVVQFRSFYRDYLGDYRSRSSGWFERNIAGALDAVIERDREHPVSVVFLSTAIPYVDNYWKLYLIKNGRQELLSRTHDIDPGAFDVTTAAPDSLFVADVADPALNRMVQSRYLELVATADEPNGTRSFGIFRRVRP